MKVSVRLWANCFSFLGLWFFTYEMRELRWMHPRVQPKSERGTVLGQMCLTGRGQEFGFYVTAATPCDPLLRPSLYVCWKFSFYHWCPASQTLQLVDSFEVPPYSTHGDSNWLSSSSAVCPELSPSPNGALGPTQWEILNPILQVRNPSLEERKGLA